VFLVARDVLADRLDGLALLWRAHGAAVRRSHRGRTWAEDVLAGRTPRVDRLRCREHPVR
jgi:hypothetical protein